MWATADEYMLTAFVNKKILLVLKIVGQKFTVTLHIQTEAAEVMKLRFVIVGIKAEFIVDFKKIIDKNQSFFILQWFVETYIFLCAVIIVAESVAADIYGCGFVYFEELLKSSAVVIVTVGEYGNIYLSQVDTEFFSVSAKSEVWPISKSILWFCVSI